MKYRIKELEYGFIPQVKVFFFFWDDLSPFTIFKTKQDALEWIRNDYKWNHIEKPTTKCKYHYIETINIR